MVKVGPPADAEERDPTPVLRPTLEMQREDQNKPFDSKRSCWIPDEKEGFVPAEIKSTKGEQVTVIFNKGEVSATIKWPFPVHLMPLSVNFLSEMIQRFFTTAFVALLVLSKPLV